MLLLDPLILTPPTWPDGSYRSATDFWDRLLDWASDRRVYVGEETHAYICSKFAEHGYPESDLQLGNAPLRREYQRALNVLLTRILRHSCEPVEVVISPRYEGSDTHGLVFRWDISGTARSSVHGIATSTDHWATVAAEILMSPPVPPRLEICCSPGAALEAEAASRLVSFYRGRRLHIVGGQRDSRVVGMLCAKFGLDEGDVEWLACEKAKPPRDLDKRWRNLKPGRDSIVCITGRVGHSTSDNVERAARRAKVDYLQVELPSQIIKRLIEVVADRALVRGE